LTQAPVEARVVQAQALRRAYTTYITTARPVAVIKARTSVAFSRAKLPTEVARNKNQASKMIQSRKAESRHRSQTQLQKLRLATIPASTKNLEDLLLGMPLLPYRELPEELA